MKTKILKGSIVAYTIFVLSAALVLFVLSDQSENFADTENEMETTIEKQKLPSGERSKTIDYGQTISIQQIFGITDEQMANLTVITDSIDTKKIGTFPIEIQFKKHGQTSHAKLFLTIKDTQKPTLIADNITIYQETTFDPLTGVKAQDNVDGDLSQKVTTQGVVDTSQEGIYELTYTVSDASHNQITKIREVTVVSEDATENESMITAPVAKESGTVQETSESSSKQSSNQATAVPKTLQPNVLLIDGQVIAYQNGGLGSGQAIIDGNTNGAVSTWGGAAIQSGSDGVNTHFIGHNPGAFSVLLGTGVGQSIIVTDSNGTATTYTINRIVHLDDYGVELGSGIDYWDQVIGTGGGERITLQTCLSETENLMVFAKA